MFQFINNQGIMFPAIIVTFAFSLGVISVISALSQETAFVAAQDIPIISLEFNGVKLDLSPIISVKDKILTRINNPQVEPDANSVVHTINNGDKISFNLGEKPSRMDAYLVDYEAEYNTLYSLDKVGPQKSKGHQEFIVRAPSPGTYNAEVHALYPDGRYTSYSKMVEIEDEKLDLLSLTPDKNKCVNEFRPNKVTAVGQPKISLSDIANQPAVKELALGPSDELIIDLEKDTDVCGLHMDLANAQNDIDFFAIQFSHDGKEFEYPIVFSNTGYGDAAEQYRYPTPIDSKYVKVVPLGSAVSEGLEIKDLRVIGN